MLILKAMGCGRSKHHSPKLGDEDREINTNKEKANGKKKKGKVDKKDSKEKIGNADSKSVNSKNSSNQKLSPVKTIVNSLKPPPPPKGDLEPTSTSHGGLHLDMAPPATKPKTFKENKLTDHLAVPGKREGKEFGGRPNIKVTNSQIAFFKMLDEKIEQGDDYASEHSVDLTGVDSS